MLVIDPLKRISMQEIVGHRWVKLGGDDPEFEELIQESLSPGSEEHRALNDAVLQHMDTIGMNKDKAVEVTTRHLLQ